LVNHSPAPNASNALNEGGKTKLRKSQYNAARALPTITPTSGKYRVAFPSSASDVAKSRGIGSRVKNCNAINSNRISVPRSCRSRLPTQT
jgi:hypothetical protein